MRHEDGFPFPRAQLGQRTGAPSGRALVDFDYRIDQTRAQKKLTKSGSASQHQVRFRMGCTPPPDQGDGEKEVSRKGGLEDEVSHAIPSLRPATAAAKST